MLRDLLRCGAVAGPFFLGSVLVQDYTRPGFNPRIHPLSLLSLGGWGWVQVVTFVVAGLLYVAGAVGLRRTTLWGGVLVGAFGVGLVGAGMFRTAPGWGYPLGAPAGVPESSDVGYVLHGVSFGVVLVSLIAGSFVFMRLFARRGERGWAVYCGITGVVLPAVYVLSGVLSDGGANSQPLSLLLRVIAVVGWVWASMVCAHLARPPGAAPSA